MLCVDLVAVGGWLLFVVDCLLFVECLILRVACRLLFVAWWLSCEPVCCCVSVVVFVC